jgi:hypothetical protein
VATTRVDATMLEGARFSWHLSFRLFQHRVMGGSSSATRLVEQHGNAVLTDLPLTVYATAGSCSSLRTADGERPVQRTKA